jgi:hypothetical protein
MKSGGRGLASEQGMSAGNGPEWTKLLAELVLMPAARVDDGLLDVVSIGPRARRRHSWPNSMAIRWVKCGDCGCVSTRAPC